MGSMELKMELVTEMQASLRHTGGLPAGVKDKRPVKGRQGGGCGNTDSELRGL